MGFNDYLSEFCKQHGYTYRFEIEEITKEYIITLSNEYENGALVMTKEELQGLSNQQIKKLLNFVHDGIQLRTNAKKKG